MKKSYPCITVIVRWHTVELILFVGANVCCLSNFADSWRHHFVGNWFDTLHCKTKFISLINVHGPVNLWERVLTHEIHEHWWFHKTTNIDDATVTCNWYKLFDNIRNPCGALTSYSVLFTTSLKPCLSNTSIVVDLEILMPSENTGRPLEFNIRRSFIKREIK